MCKAMEDLRNESILEGIDIGDLRTTVKYYKKGKITLEEAAEDLNMTVEEFRVIELFEGLSILLRGGLEGLPLFLMEFLRVWFEGLL